MFSASAAIQKEDSWKFFRLCFAAVNEDEVGPISKRLADGVPAFFRIKDKDTIEKLLEEDEEEVAKRCQAGEMAQMMGPC